MAEPPKGRIAIKFGTTSTNSAKSKPSTSKPGIQLPPPTTLGKRPRTTNDRVWGADDSDSDGDDHGHLGRHETITGFGAQGAEAAAAKEYVISKQPNRGWKANAKTTRKGGKNLLPPEAQAQQQGTVIETEPADQDKEVKWGLTVKKKSAPGDEKDEPQLAESPSEPSKDVALREKPSETAPSRTADDEAMDALLGLEPEKEHPVIAHDEPDAFKRELRDAGDAPTLDDHEAMPIEEFGAALLRGMGWNGESNNTKPKASVRRPVKLGFGGKELKEAEDLGGWNQQSGTKKKRTKLSDYKRAEDLKKESRRNDNSYKSERERERNGDRGSDRDRYRDKDRDRDSGRHHDRHHHRDSRRS